MTGPDTTDTTALRAINALPTDQARDYDDSLDDHPERRSDLAGYHEVLALLTETEATDTLLLPDLLAALGSPGNPGNPGNSGESTVISLDPSRRDRSRRLGLAAMAVAAAAITVVTIGSLFVRDRGPDLGLEELASAAIEAPDADVVTLVDGDGTTVGKTAVQADGSGFVIIDGLGTPGADEVFQLWQLSAGDPVSIGFVNADGLAAIQLSPGATGLAVSIENKDGAVAPTIDRIVATGELA